MSAATKLGNLATAIKAAIDDAGIESHGNDLLVYKYEGRELDSLPAVTISGPVSIIRTEPDEAESQLGSDDWRMTFVLRIYVAQDDPETAEDDMRAILGQVIAAIDADRTLGGEAEIDASLTNGDVSPAETASERQLLVFTGDLQVWSLI